VGNARQPRQRPTGGGLVDVLDPRVDDSSLIMGAGQISLGCGGGEQFCDWVGAGGGEEQQVTAQRRPCRLV
jgi:hypothetical protein